MDKVKIYKDSYTLLVLLHRSMHEMPRSDRYLFGAKMNECALEMLDGITLAYQARGKADRLDRLEEFFKSFTRLQTYLRLCLDLKLMSLNTLAKIHPFVEEISKQHNGWKNRTSRM